MLDDEKGKGKKNREGERRVDNISPNDRVLGDFEILTLLLDQTRGCTQLPAEQGLMAPSLPFPWDLNLSSSPADTELGSAWGPALAL